MTSLDPREQLRREMGERNQATVKRRRQRPKTDARKIVTSVKNYAPTVAEARAHLRRWITSRENLAKIGQRVPWQAVAIDVVLLELDEIDDPRDAGMVVTELEQDPDSGPDCRAPEPRARHNHGTVPLQDVAEQGVTSSLGIPNPLHPEAEAES